MFSGIVESVGTVSKVSGDKILELAIDTPWYEEIFPTGASLAVNGCCLTILRQEQLTSNRLQICFDVGQESAQLSNLGGLKVGDLVNLERPLKFGARLDGHLVAGHVDGLGEISAVKQFAEIRELLIQFSPKHIKLIVQKGSVTVDGVSLTVNRIVGNAFTVALLPYTWQHTTLGLKKVGNLVNLEFDMIGKYIATHYQKRAAARPTV